MSAAYLGRSAGSLHQSVYSGYSTGTAASQGRIARRTPAPRFHPCVIIFAVIFVGMVIIGLVMTIIANWPGYSSIGFNALEIVGPIILGVGGLALIGTIAVVVMRNKYQNEEWERKMIDVSRSRSILASRMTLDGYQTPTQSYGKPSRSILKKTPSTSTYGRDSNVFEEDGEPVLGYPNGHRQSYGPEDPNGPHRVYNIETMPDPPAARAQMRHGSNHMSQPPYREQPSSDSESHVPVPIRVPQQKKSRRQPQYQQEAYATQPVPSSPLVGTPDVGGMSDRISYSSDQENPIPPSTPTRHVPQPVPMYSSEHEYDQPIPSRVTPEGAYQTASAVHAAAVPAARRDDVAAQDADLNRDNRARHSRRKKKKKPEAESAAAAPLAGGDAQSPPEVDHAKPQKRKKRSKPAAAATATALPVSAAAQPQGSPTLTRINISAQPGTSVSITPGGPQYGHQPTVHNTSRGSVETEI